MASLTAMSRPLGTSALFPTSRFIPRHRAVSCRPARKHSVTRASSEPSGAASLISSVRNPRNYFLSQGIVRACMATLILTPDLHHILVAIMKGFDKLLGGAGDFALSISGDAGVFMGLAGLALLMLSISDWAVVLGQKTYAEIKIKLQMELVWVTGIIIAGVGAIKAGLSKSWWAMVLLGVIHLLWAIEIYNNRNKIYYGF